MFIRIVAPFVLLLLCVLVAGAAMAIKSWLLLLAAMIVGGMGLFEAYANGWGRVIPEARLRSDRVYKIEHQTRFGGHAIVFIRNLRGEILVVQSTHADFTRCAIRDGNVSCSNKK